jgi:hypothetical protein
MCQRIELNDKERQGKVELEDAAQIQSVRQTQTNCLAKSTSFCQDDK